MIEYNKKTGDNQIERVTSASLDGAISLTWLWEIIVRTKRLPEDLEPKILFLVLRDRLRNPEREVRQHALRVLADLIPVMQQELLDENFDVLLPELILNLSNVSPSVRKGSVDVLIIYLKHTRKSDEVLNEIITSVPEDSHLRLGIVMAIPYFSNQMISENSVNFLIHQLFRGTVHDFLREASVASLVKTRSKLGSERFNYILKQENLSEEFQTLCDEFKIHLTEKDNVILETEITLNTGPAITMKIHEESSDDLKENEENLMLMRSPRKVHFGGEVVKMRTPESDSNQQSSDDNDLQASLLVIDQNTNIKIVLGDNVKAVKTTHTSRIPIRISASSNPSTPRKKIEHKKRLHTSAPELRISRSRIPLKQNTKSNANQRNNDLSPVVPHNPIEMFHNLTRSPEPEATINSSPAAAYESFRVYDEEIKNENNTPNPLDLIVRDLTYIKGDNWTQVQALDNLTAILNDSSTHFQSKSISNELFQALFACEKQTRLQNKAHEALRMIISRVDLQNLQEHLPQLCNNLVNLLGSSRVRLSLLTMERSSPRKFFENIQISPGNREAALQVLIAAARTFPSSELDVIKGVHMAFEALQDTKRCVRQAGLEALASLAQVAGNVIILDTISDLAKDLEKSEQLLRVIRTRLSRRQLPIVDLNGNIRYSSPREQEEFDWLCGGVVSLSKTMSLNSIKVPYSANNNNYWKHNLRHDLVKSPSAENTENSSNEESSRSNKKQTWGTEGNNGFPSIERGALYPVYVLQRDSPQVNGRSYRNFDRGRSNSPPSRKKFESQDSLEDNNGNMTKRFLSRQNEAFKKSFSSEQLYNGHLKSVEPTSFSLSSRSSTTSTGSSTRSGLWLRSGIPVPITSDSKLKLRTHNRQSAENSGPLITAQTPPLSLRTKIDSSRISTPVVVIRNSPNIQNGFTHQQLLASPHSSGSESSGYFTPPAEHHLVKDQIRFISEEESFQKDEVDEGPNFQIVDSELEVSDVQENDDQRQSSGSSFARTSPKIISAEDHRVEENIQKESPPELDEIDFPTFSDQKSKSKSEINLKSTLPDINNDSRKTLNSAPPLNDLVNIVPYKFSPTPLKTSLPGSVASIDTTPIKKPQNKEEDGDFFSGNNSTIGKKLLRRSNKKTSSSSSRTNNNDNTNSERPYTRPKEALNLILSQMDSSEWESVLQGLNSLIRLSCNHPDVIENQIHQVCVALAKNIKNLRSQVARAACHASSELFTSCKRSLDMELEELAGTLLQRTADTNKFLRGDANAALDAMSLNLSLPRVVAVITNKGSTHHNCVVRAASTRLLSDIAVRLGPERIFQLPKETRDKFLLVGANGLTEGSLEIRRYAKNLMAVLAKHPLFQKGLADSVPQHTIRHITKVLNSL